jgi:hypothetical protein
MARAADAAHAFLVNLSCGISGPRNCAPNCVRPLPRPVALPRWTFATLPTAVAADEQWHCDHPADDAADDQPRSRCGSRPRQLPTNDHDVRHHTQTTMNWSESSRGLIIAANERAERTRHLTRSVIIVGVDGSAEAEAVAAAVREAELRKT